MERKIVAPLRRYKHQQLMDQLNDLMLFIKVHHHIDGQPEEVKVKVRGRHPLPSVEELDKLHREINQVLSEDSEPYVKY